MAQLPSSSRAAVLHEFKGPFVVEEVPLPKELEPGAILTKMDLATICGSDIHIWQGESRPGVLPLILGHEMAGRVHALGPGVETDSLGQSLREGDRIIWTHAACGRCYQCVVEREESLCDNRIATVAHPVTKFPYVVGSLAEYCYVLPTAGRVKVPDEVPSEEASAASCAFRSVARGFDRLGHLSALDTVVVQGAGPLGLFATAMAVQAGVAKTITIGAPEQRLGLARRFGATHTINIDEVPDAAARTAQVRGLTDGQGPSVVIEVSGGATAFLEGIDMARKGGRYLMLGQVPRHTVTFSPNAIQTKQLDIIPSTSASTEHYYKALQFMKVHRDRFPFGEMMTNRYQLDDINEAMNAMKDFREIKPVVLFGS